MKKVFLFVATGVIALVVLVFVERRSILLTDANVEALADGESQTINVQCSMTSPILYCGVYCHSCGLLWTVPGTSGQYISGSGVCTCGATL
jgi:hypothetical protein